MELNELVLAAFFLLSIAISAVVARFTARLMKISERLEEVYQMAKMNESSSMRAMTSRGLECSGS